jgi:UDP:flavonoid glycosyltransferase YjiC (YdhE family)
VGSRVAWSGAGVNLKTGLPTPEQLRQAILEVLRDPAYRQNAERIRSDFARYDSPNVAAQLVERLVETKKQEA